MNFMERKFINQQHDKLPIIFPSLHSDFHSGNLIPFDEKHEFVLIPDIISGVPINGFVLKQIKAYGFIPHLRYAACCRKIEVEGDVSRRTF
jgi:hypothetical protein